MVISTCNNSSHLRKKNVSHSLEKDESLPCAMLATAYVNVGVGTRLQRSCCYDVIKPKISHDVISLTTS